MVVVVARHLRRVRHHLSCFRDPSEGGNSINVWWLAEGVAGGRGGRVIEEEDWLALGGV